MLTRAISPPAFGKADLSNCEREQIHLAGSIQPHGAVLLLREPDQIIVQASENAASFLGLQHDIIGRRLEAIEGDLARKLRPHLTDPLHDVPRGIRCHVGNPSLAFDCLIHRPNGGGLIIELERAGASVDLSRYLEQGLQTIIAAASLQTLCDETARIFKALTGYHRVMIYRFDDQGHGEVFSEEREPDREAYLGNRYPASDIPQIARRLYERNRIRVLVDVEYRAGPANSQALADQRRRAGHVAVLPAQFLAYPRAVSEEHGRQGHAGGLVDGQRATLGIGVGSSLRAPFRPFRGAGRLRIAGGSGRDPDLGLGKLLSGASRTVCAPPGAADDPRDLQRRRLARRIVRRVHGRCWRRSRRPEPLCCLRVRYELSATYLRRLALREIGRWLDAQPQGGVIATASLGQDAPQFELLTAIASGLLATPVSTSPGEYLIWLRPERVRTVTWGGNPFKPILVGDDAKTLSPRRSFSQWHQLVEGTADPWSDADLAAARLVGDTVSDVIIQFRSVRVLLAEDQLSQVRQQVERSHQPVIIADAAGNILKLNAAVAALLPDAATQPRSVAELLPLFANSDEIERHLEDLVVNRRAWRGEVLVAGAGGAMTPLLVRADPVFTALDRTVGFVLLFTDLTERKAAEASRRGFQESVIKQRPVMSGKLDSKADLLFRNVLSTIVENAQLAALEIADRVDPARMPQMLEALRASVARTAEVLRYLVWHATRRAKGRWRENPDVSNVPDSESDD